jgi:predicted RNase H-like HicB family nuclease
MKEIFFIVQEDPESGYTARAVGQSIFTEAETISELKINIKEVLECHFENIADMPKIAHLHFIKDEILTLV